MIRFGVDEEAEREKTADERAIDALMGREPKSELVLPVLTEEEAFVRQAKKNIFDHSFDLHIPVEPTKNKYLRPDIPEPKFEIHKYEPAPSNVPICKNFCIFSAGTRKLADRRYPFLSSES